MAPYLASPSKQGLDLRAPAFATLRRGSMLGWVRISILFFLDVVLLAVSWAIAETYSTPVKSVWLVRDNPLSLVLVVCISVSIFAAHGLYKAGEKRRDYLGLAKAMTLAAVILLLTAYLHAPGKFVSRSHFISFWILSSLLTSAGRFMIDLATDTLREKGAVRYPVFLISDQDNCSDAIALIERENRYNILGIVDARALDRAKRDITFANIRNLGIVEAFVSWDAIKNRLFLCWYFQTAGITLHVLPIGIESLFQRSEFWMIGGTPSLTFPPPVITGFNFGVKRVFDFCCAVIFIVLAFPLYGLIALLIKLDSPGPILYQQTRIGLHGNPFKVWKFRTMVCNADKLQRELEAMNESKDGILFKIKDDPRITRVGRILRQHSLDELPQIFNVLLGEMSFVGPRPLPTRDVDKFAEHHYIRHEVLPGITGMWQVSGRSDVDNFEDVVRLDLSYIEHWSLWLDLKILLQTVKVVLHKTGAY